MAKTKKTKKVKRARSAAVKMSGDSAAVRATRSHCYIVCSQSLEGAPEFAVDRAIDSYGIAVDGGFEFFEAIGVVPEVWVGDGDSIRPKPLAHLRQLEKEGLACHWLKTDKAFSDLEFAIQLAAESYLNGEWTGDLVLLGAQGGRFDHEFGNMQLAQALVADIAHLAGVEKTPNVVSFGPRGMWAITTRMFRFRRPKGTVFSVMPFDGHAELSITGGKYKQSKGFLDHVTQGLSNEVGAKGEVVVQVHPHANSDSHAHIHPILVVVP